MGLFSKKNKSVRKSKKKKLSPRARRDAKIKAQRNKQIASLVIVVALIGGISFSAYYNNSLQRFSSWVQAGVYKETAEAGFKVDDIFVIGRSEISKNKLLKELSIKRGMPIFAVDIEGAKDGLYKISWIKDVYISRKLPNKILVELNERVPVAIWQHNKSLSLIDNEGVILTRKNLKKWKDLPLITGRDSRQSVASLTALLKAEPLIAQEVVSARRIGARRWDLNLKNGVLVKLPEHDTEFALRRLVSIDNEKKILDKNINVVDLRAPEKMVVKLVKSAKKKSPKNEKKEAGV